MSNLTVLVSVAEMVAVVDVMALHAQFIGFLNICMFGIVHVHPAVEKP